MSLRASASLPCSCSGDMYGAVPTSIPAEVRGESCGCGDVTVIAAEQERSRGRAHGARRRRLGQAEIEQFGAGSGEHYVSGLQVAVDDAGAMRLVERIQNLDPEPPETFTFGGMLAHVITFHACRRMVAIDGLRELGLRVDGAGCPMEYRESVRRAASHRIVVR